MKLFTQVSELGPMALFLNNRAQVLSISRSCVTKELRPYLKGQGHTGHTCSIEHHPYIKGQGHTCSFSVYVHASSSPEENQEEDMWVS